MKDIAKEILSIADKRRESRENALNILLDCSIIAFSPNRLTEETIGDWQKDMEKLRVSDYSNVIKDMTERVAKSVDGGKAFDYFGSMYEELFQSKGKASATGQFFTPSNITDLMAELVAPTESVLNRKERVIAVNDPAVGSGRTLISAYTKFLRSACSANHDYVFIGEDIDPVSCKMCALNMMLHGMYGAVMRHDTLMYDEPSVIYIVNECRVPFNTDLMCVRELIGEDAHKWWTDYKKHGMWLLTRIFDRDYVRKALRNMGISKEFTAFCLGSMNGNMDVAEVKTEVRIDEETKKEYVQLNLFGNE